MLVLRTLPPYVSWRESNSPGDVRVDDVRVRSYFEGKGGGRLGREKDGRDREGYGGTDKNSQE